MFYYCLAPKGAHEKQMSVCPRELQESFKRASRELQGSFKGASRELLESKREPGRVTFGAKALVVLVLNVCSFRTIFI